MIALGRPATGWADSLLAVTFINLISGKRHIAGFIRTADVCDCGCGGYDTIHGLLSVTAMMAESLVKGLSPEVRHDGEPHWFYDEEIMKTRPGEDLKFRGVFIHVKGDWCEYQKSLGFGSWGKVHNSCPFCETSRDEMLSDCSGLGFYRDRKTCTTVTDSPSVSSQTLSLSCFRARFGNRALGRW